MSNYRMNKKLITKEVKMKKIVVLLAAVTFMSIGLVNAQPNKPNRPIFQNNGGIYKMLNLTADQQKQFSDIMYNQRLKAVDIRADIEKNRIEIQKMIRDNNIDEGKILSLTDANSKLQAELKSERIKSWLAVYKILTPEQKELWSKNFGRMGNARGFMRERINRLKDNFGSRPMMRNRMMY